ncbi:MAG: hypothetical protein M0T72_13355 [Candidatus Dormibacteraeota bacterium]|nr:hypothetical protein [Candidatus Dormibacteraeota bacterium]
MAEFEVRERARAAGPSDYGTALRRVMTGGGLAVLREMRDLPGLLSG